MTCTLLVIDGCRSVNDVTYCYCKGELCNTVPLPAEETDDEDMTEGSGLTVTTTTVLPSYHNHTTVSTTSASFNRSSSPFTIFLLISLSAWRWPTAHLWHLCYTRNQWHFSTPNELLAKIPNHTKMFSVHYYLCHIHYFAKMCTKHFRVLPTHVHCVS